jgi:hypothetical protein
MSRRGGGNGKPPSWEELAAEEFVWHFPAVVEFLASCSWGEGVSRTPGTLLLFTDQGCWKAAVHDRDQGETLFVSDKSLEGLLASVERHIVEGSGEWRKDRRSGGKKSGDRS